MSALLTQLPPELRDTIYAFILADGMPTLFAYRDHDQHSQLLAPPVPALAKTCRQLRDEVLAIYFHTLLIEKWNACMPMRDGDTLCHSPAFQRAMKYAKSVEFAVRAEVHYDSYSHSNGLQVHSQVNTEIVNLRVTRTDHGVRLVINIADRCHCDPDRAIQDIEAKAASTFEAFGQAVAWVEGKLVHELEKEYQCSETCKNCGGHVPRPELRARDAFGEDDPVMAWLVRQWAPLTYDECSALHLI